MSPTPSPGARPINAHFEFRPEDQKDCTASKRFRGFAALFGHLQKYVLTLSWSGGSDWENCLEDIKKSFAKSTPEVLISDETDPPRLIASFRKPSETPPPAPIAVAPGKDENVEEAQVPTPVALVKPKAEIKVPGDIPRLLDINTGLGLSYGRGLPGEVKGNRFAFGARYTQRSIIADYGIRADILSTLASNSIVPFTFRGNALIVRSFSFEDGMWYAGLGVQYFMAKVSKEKQFKKAEQTIPEQVLGPLVEIGGEYALGKGGFIGAALAVTPLYVPDSGFYPSYSPKVETGLRISPLHLVVLGLSSDTVRYPTQAKVTRITLETYYLGFKQIL